MAVVDRLKSFRFNFIAFFIGFAVGLIYIYYKHPEQQIHIAWPTPYNSGKITYKDNVNTCFQYVSTRMKCPDDKKIIKPQPIMTDNK